MGFIHYLSRECVSPIFFKLRFLLFKFLFIYLIFASFVGTYYQSGNTLKEAKQMYEC